MSSGTSVVFLMLIFSLVAITIAKSFKNKKNNMGYGVSTKKSFCSPTNDFSRGDALKVILFFISCHLICYLGGLFYYLEYKSISLTILWYALLIPITIGSIIIFQLDGREISKEFIEFWNQHNNDKRKKSGRWYKIFFPVLEVFIK